MPPRRAPRRLSCRLSGAAALATALVTALIAAPSARADPQGTFGLTIGVAGAGVDRRIWKSTAFHLGLRGDVLFGRSSNQSFGLGPYAELLTNGFDEIQFGGGVSGLLPIIDTFPLVLSAGGYGRAAAASAFLESQTPGPFGVEGGLAGSLFWGSRSYNFHSSYVMTAGLLTELRYGLGPSRETSILVSAQIDFAILTLPAVFLINAIRGGSHETDPVK
jgi:hypothetical protein